MADSKNLRQVSGHSVPGGPVTRQGAAAAPSLAGVYTRRFPVTAVAIDVNGHVNNLAYVAWMQEIAIEHSAAAGWPIARFQAIGAAGVIISADGKNGVLVVDQLETLSENQEYQVWLERDSTETSGGLFGVDEDGYRGMRIVAPESLLTYSSVRVTIEPKGGSSRPTGPEVLKGSLFNSRIQK